MPRIALSLRPGISIARSGLAGSETAEYPREESRFCTHGQAIRWVVHQDTIFHHISLRRRISRFAAVPASAAIHAVWIIGRANSSTTTAT